MVLEVHVDAMSPAGGDPPPRRARRKAMKAALLDHSYLLAPSVRVTSVGDDERNAVHLARRVT